jgi:hypothetical protein
MPAREMAVKAIAILHVMHKSFQQDIKIYNNHNNELQDYTLTDVATFATVYHVTSVKGNPKKNQTHLTWIIHRVGTQHSVPDIHKHPEVLTLLQRLQAKFQFHAWPTNVWNVVSVGLLTGAIPWYSLPSQI